MKQDPYLSTAALNDFFHMFMDWPSGPKVFKIVPYSANVKKATDYAVGVTRDVFVFEAN